MKFSLIYIILIVVTFVSLKLAPGIFPENGLNLTTFHYFNGSPFPLLQVKVQRTHIVLPQCPIPSFNVKL